MKTEEFVSCLDELVRCYKHFHSENSTTKEVNFWRCHFLEQKKIDDPTLRMLFQFIPSDEFINKTPEEWIKICEKKHGRY